jgi:hypothetical protein
VPKNLLLGDLELNYGGYLVLVQKVRYFGEANFDLFLRNGRTLSRVKTLYRLQRDVGV